MDRTLNGFTVLKAQEENKKVSVLPMIITLLSASSMSFCMVSMFYEEISYVPMFVTILFTVLFLMLFSKNGKMVLTGLAVFLFLTVDVVVFGYAQWQVGALDFINRMLLRYNYITGLAIDYYEVPKTDTYMVAMQCFLCVMAALLTYYQGLAILRKHALILLFCWIPLIAGGVFLEVPVTGFGIVCGVLSVIGTFAYSQMEMRNDSAYVFAFLGVAALTAVGGFCYFQMVDYKPSNTVEQMQEYVMDKTEEIQYGTADLPQGEVEKVVTYSEDIRLKVSMSKPQNLYLKGYVGSVWKTDRWQTLEGKKYSEKYEGMIKGYVEQSFHPLSQLSGYIEAASFASDTLIESEEMQITVQNLSAFRKYTYLPYGISFASLMELKESNQDMYIPGNTSEEVKDNTYVASIQCTKQDAFLNYFGQEWLDAEADYNETTAKYRIAESDYRNFVHEYYKSIDKKEVASIEELSKLDKKNIMDMTVQIREYVKNEGKENGNYTSVDYASAAVKLYQGLEVPARYVEGYYVNGEESQIAEDGYYHVDVKGYNAHAWVEIYKDGIGWIPVDVTPGFYKDLTNNIQTQEVVQQQQKQAVQQQSMEQIKEDKDTSFMEGFVKVLLYMVAGIIGFLLVVVTGLLIRRKWILYKKKKGLESENMWERMDMSSRILREIFQYKKWEETGICPAVKNVLNIYRYSKNAEERVGEKDVEIVLKYAIEKQQDILENATRMERIRIKYFEVIV